MIAELVTAVRTSGVLRVTLPGKRRLDVPPQHRAKLGKLALAPIGHVNIHQSTGAPVFVPL
jgi:hypothetical protein